VTLIAAVDPGASPTIAYLSHDNVVWFVEGDALAGKTKTGKTRPIPQLCREGLQSGPGGTRPDLLVIEDARGMPGDNRGSGEVLTYCVGLFEGMAAMADIRVVKVQPVVWKRHHGLIRADKDASRRAACELLPAQALLFARKKDEHRAEAALMCLWGAQRAR